MLTLNEGVKGDRISSGRIPSIQSSFQQLNNTIGQNIQAGDFLSCFRLLKKELRDDELKSSSADELFHQILLARVLASVGLQEIPFRICGRVLRSLKWVAGVDHWRCLYNIMAIYNILCRFDLVNEEFNNLFSKNELAKMNFQKAGNWKSFLEILYLQNRVMLGNSISFAQMDELFKKFIIENSSSRMVCLHAQALLLENTYDAFKIDLPLASCTKKNDQATAFIHEIEAMSLSAQNEQQMNLVKKMTRLKARVLSREQPAQALKLFSASCDGSPYSTIEHLFYVRKFKLRDLSLAENVALFLYPMVNHYSRVLGNSYLKDIQLYGNAILHFYRSEESNERDADCWLIFNGQVSKILYQKQRPFEQNLLDLNCGTVVRNSEILHLTALRANILSTIIASGSLGTSEERLIEVGYLSEQCDVLSLSLRIRDLVTQLMKLNFPIYRKGGRIYWSFESWPYAIILPLEYQAKGLFLFFQNHQNNRELEFFSRVDVLMALNVSKRKANSLIGDWGRQRLILKKSNGKYYWNKM